MILQPGDVEQVAQLKVVLLGWSHPLHFFNQLYNEVLILCQIVSVHQFKVNLLF